MTSTTTGQDAGAPAEPRPVPVHRSGPAGVKLALPIQHLRQKTDRDCIRTCIAMMLGFDNPEAVPCFYEGGDGKAWERAENWLLHAGYGLVSIPMRPPTVQQAISRIKGNINLPVILGANHDESDPASSHYIVVTPERVHDPAYDEPGVHCLSALHTTGEVWVMAIVPFSWPHRTPESHQ